MADILDAETFLATVPEHIRGEAFDLHPFMAYQYAFPLESAFEILTAIQAQGHRVLGGDVWLISRSDGVKPIPTGTNWIAPRAGDYAELEHSLSDFMSRLKTVPDHYMTWVAESPR